jgi:uncharacterized protein YyaL (SSP411 family)
MKYLLGLLTFVTGMTTMAAGKAENNMTNRLANETSPYLQQHAHNPVDWYPWGPEAFARARAENKPVFLSVGYSTCHWCHVMAHESFENKAIAEILNRHFISIKVDREQRPEVDEIYMLATQLMNRSGGWPNSVFLTPDKKPFYAGTYYPPAVFSSLLTQLAERWKSNNAEILANAEQVSGVIDQIMNHRTEAKELTQTAMADARAAIIERFDSFYGGFRSAPKFPQESILMFLLHMGEKYADAEAINAVKTTLAGILNGGMHDQVGGGFHRYSTDNEWLVPHFEKMLYNQAQLAMVLARAYSLLGDQRYADELRRTLAFVLSDMHSPEGGFYSAWDADSEGEEGTFYVWDMGELLEVLDKSEADFAIKVFGVTQPGNFEGRNILHFATEPDEAASNAGMSADEFHAKVDGIRQKLHMVRERRIKPHRDDKIIVSWNGMMISAFAKAGAVLGDEKYINAGEVAGEFIWSRMRTADGKLLRAFMEGDASIAATQEDYAFLALGFLALYDATGNKTWLTRAEELAKSMVNLFRDPAAGNYYMGANKESFTRGKSYADGAIPSGNAAALEVFALLSRRAGADLAYQQYGEELLAAMSGEAISSPPSGAYALMAGDTLLHGETRSLQYLGKGNVRARAYSDRVNNRLLVRLNIADGWHVNSNKPLEDFLIPTSLSLMETDTATQAVYPEPISRSLRFNDNSPLSLYEGEVDIYIPLTKAKDSLQAQLELQVCSDEICLAPETVIMRLRK